MLRQKLKNKKNLFFLLLFTAINNCVLGSNLNTVTGEWYMALLQGQLVSRQRKNNIFFKKHIIIILKKKLFTY